MYQKEPVRILLEYHFLFDGSDGAYERVEPQLDAVYRDDALFVTNMGSDTKEEWKARVKEFCGRHGRILMRRVEETDYGVETDVTVEQDGQDPVNITNFVTFVDGQIVRVERAGDMSKVAKY